MSLRRIAIATSTRCETCPEQIISCWHASGSRQPQEWVIGLVIRSYATWGTKIIEQALPAAPSKKLRKMRKKLRKRVTVGLRGFGGSD